MCGGACVCVRACVCSEDHFSLRFKGQSLTVCPNTLTATEMFDVCLVIMTETLFDMDRNERRGLRSRYAKVFFSFVFFVFFF